MSDPPPFWKTKPLGAMSRAEWESICDGCGRCCLHKLRDDDTDELAFTEVACRLLDTETCLCSSYATRRAHVPDCVKLTPRRLAAIDWLPPSCGYRLLAEGKDLPWWHPLVSGTPDTVHQAGVSVRGKAISERYAGPLEDHVVAWPGRLPRRSLRRPASPDEPADAGNKEARKDSPMQDALFGGVNAAILTPMHEDLSPNLDLLAKRAGWLLSHGCDGLGLLGTTGEANSFSVSERIGVIEGIAARGVDVKRLMPGTGCAALTDTVELTRVAAKAGCRGVLVLPPFYYKQPTDDGLFAWFSEVINRAGANIAYYLYHFPQQSAVPFSLALVERLLRAFPGTVKGMKDSSGDWNNTAAMIDNFAKDGFEVYSGADEHLQRNLQQGGAGCITASTNLNSPWAAEVYARRTGPEAEAAQAAMAAIRNVVAGPKLIPNIRELVARTTGEAAWRTIRPPHLPLPAAEGEALWAKFQALGALTHRLAAE